MTWDKAVVFHSYSGFPQHLQVVSSIEKAEKSDKGNSKNVNLMLQRVQREETGVLIENHRLTPSHWQRQGSKSLSTFKINL